MSDREKVINDQQREIEELEERLAIVLEGQPEIVRCKDCKYGFPLIDSAYITCGRRFHDGQKHEADWFCADGRRRQ